MKISLNGEWMFRQSGTQVWEKAVVPGCNYLDLLRNGKILDPFLGVNEKETYWEAKKDWEYKRGYFMFRKICFLMTVYALNVICWIQYAIFT